MTKWILGVALALLVGAPAYADAQPASENRNNGCMKYTLCDAQPTGSTGVCTSRDTGDEVVAAVGARYTITFYTTQSTSATYVCDVYTNDQGYDAYSGAVAHGVGQQINSASMTESNRTYSTAGEFEYIWGSCGTISSLQVTMTALVCPLAR